MAREASVRLFGLDKAGQAVSAVTLESGELSATVLTLGATLQALTAPDREGRADDIILGHDDVEGYTRSRDFFGVTVGRYANRIGQGRFELDGRSYVLDVNDGVQHLHGGFTGFDTRTWTIEEATPTTVVLSIISPDGDGGYPGELSARASYFLAPDGTLTIDLEATTDRPTIVNMTNHAFFNLSGAGIARAAVEHVLDVDADAFTPVDEGLIPIGEIRLVDGGPFDFRSPRRIADGARDGTDLQVLRGRGYDHNLVLNGPRGALRRAAGLSDPASGRKLELFTTEAGLQLYSGNFLGGSSPGKKGRLYRQGDGVCLEPQTFPDAPNKPHFPSARLDPGQTYRHTIVLKLSVADIAS